MATKVYLGAALILVILTSSIYFLMPDKVRIDIENTKTKYSVMENGSFILAATEYIYLYDGSTKMRATSRETKNWNDSKYAYGQRTSTWKDNITTIQTYKLSKDNMAVELFPLENKFECFNCQGKIVHYEVRDILYNGETKEINSPFIFGHKMKMEWQKGSYYSKVSQQKYASDKIIVKYRPLSDSEVYSVRLSDPELSPITLNSLKEKEVIDVGLDKTQGISINIINNEATHKCLGISINKTISVQDIGFLLKNTNFNVDKLNGTFEKKEIVNYQKDVYEPVCLPFQVIDENETEYTNQNCTRVFVETLDLQRVDWNNISLKESEGTEIEKLDTFEILSEGDYRHCFDVPWVKNKNGGWGNKGEVQVTLDDKLFADYQGSSFWNLSLLNRNCFNINPYVTEINQQLELDLGYPINTSQVYVLLNATDTQLAWVIENNSEMNNKIWTNTSVTAGSEFGICVYYNTSDVSTTPQYNLSAVMLQSNEVETATDIARFKTITASLNSTVFHRGYASATPSAGGTTLDNGWAIPVANVTTVGYIYSDTTTIPANIEEGIMFASSGLYQIGLYPSVTSNITHYSTWDSSSWTSTAVPIVAGWSRLSMYFNNTANAYINGIRVFSDATPSTNQSVVGFRAGSGNIASLDTLFSYTQFDNNPIITAGVEEGQLINISIIQYLEAIYWDSDEVDYALNVTIQNLDSSTATSLTLKVDSRFNSTTISVGTIPAYNFKTFRFTNTTALRDASADKTFNLTQANVTEGTTYDYSNTLDMFIPGQVGGGGAVAGDPLCTQYLQVDSFTGLTIEYNLTVQCVNPKTDTNYTNVTITPYADFGSPATIGIIANHTNQTSFYNTTSRGTSDGSSYTISGADITINITQTTNAIDNFIPIDPPYAFTKDGIVDCDQNMYVNKDITLAVPITFRGAGDFLISAVLRVTGFEKYDTDCKVVINGSGHLEVV